MNINCKFFSRRGLPLVILLFTINCVGCSTVKPYPFCIYNGQPDESIFSAHLESSIEVIKKVTGKDEIKTHYVNVQNRRWLLIEGDEGSHKKINRVWPPLACIAHKPYSSDLGARKYRTCLLTVEKNVFSDSIVGRKNSAEFSGEIDSDSLEPNHLLWCNGSETF